MGHAPTSIDRPASGDDQETVDADSPPSKAIVIEQLRDMVERNDNDPVPREGVIWSCVGDIGKSSAEHALDELIEQGDVIEMDDGVIPT
jgi:hypothetical protein